MAELQQNPFTSEAFSNRLRYEAFSEMAADVNQSTTLEDIGGALLRHLKYVVSFNGAALWFFDERGGCQKIEIIRSDVKIGYCGFAQIPNKVKCNIDRQIPELLESREHQILTNNLYSQPLPKTTRSMINSCRKFDGNGFSIVFSKKDDSAYTFSDVKFANLVGEFLLTKIDQIQTGERLKAANTELSDANQRIEEQHQDMIDSLNYADRIQRSLLHHKASLLDPFSGKGFVFHQSKTIVTGDFYWSFTRGSQTVVVVADCTGHGVPGAFLTLTAVRYLSQICENENTLSPGKILTRLDTLINQQLNTEVKNDDDVVKDGMDAAVVLIDRNDCSIRFSGAKRPLYWYKPELDKLEKTRGSIHPVGSNYLQQNRVYELHRHHYSPGDRIYLCSDGYVDQFGGPKEKKFKTGPFKEMLEGFQTLSMQEQKKHLNDTLNSWKGDHPLTDDVLVVGLEL